MKVQISKQELSQLIHDLYRYSDGCEHAELDECCVFCQAKMVLYYFDNEEVEIVDESCNFKTVHPSGIFNVQNTGDKP